MAEFPAVAPFPAALFCPRPKKRRRNEPPVENRAPFRVCDQKMVGYSPIERTLTIILPNIIHGCKKLNLKRR